MQCKNCTAYTITLTKGVFKLDGGCHGVTWGRPITKPTLTGTDILGGFVREYLARAETQAVPKDLS